MAKLYNYLVFIAILTSVFIFTGVGETALGNLLESFGIDINSEGSTITLLNVYVWGLIMAILASTGIGIAASFFGSSPSESYALGPLVTVLAGFVFEFVALMNYFSSNTFVYVIIMVIFPGIIIGYLLAIIEWWRGTD